MVHTNGHLSQQKFAEFMVQSDPGIASVNAHIESCDTCQEFLNLLQSTKTLAGKSTAGTGEPDFSPQDISDNIIKVYNKSLKQKNAAKFYKLLTQSSACFDETFGMVADSLAPVSEEDEQELQVYSDLSLADKVLQMAPPLPQPVSLISRINKRIGIDFRLRLQPSLAWAAAFVLFLSVGYYGGYRYYVTTYQINSAADLLVANHRVYFKYPQPSGDYGSSAIEQLMAGEDKDKPETPLEKAQRLTNKAIERGSRSPKAKQVLAHIFLFERDYAKADSVLNTIADKGKLSADLLNDFGVAKFGQRNWSQAADYFISAIQVDPDFKKAYFNLALTYEKAGEKEKALIQIEKYLGLEKDEGWIPAAQSLIQRLQ